MKLHNLENRRQSGYTTFGCIWEKGSLGREAEFALYDGQGKELPMQSRITAYWPDGSLKWTAHTADSCGMGGEIEVLPEKPAEPLRRAAVRRTKEGMEIDAGLIRLTVPESGDSLFSRLTVDGRTMAEQAVPELILEEPFRSEEAFEVKRRQYRGVIREVSVAEEGPVQIVLRYQGIHRDRRGEEKLPFVLYLKVGLDCPKVDFIHTFVYDGDEDRDFLKGLGVRFRVPLRGAVYNRHIKLQGDYGCFHEATAELLGGGRLPQTVYERQMNGERLDFSASEEQAVREVTENIPLWSEYEFFQDSISHFGVRKKVAGEDCCYLDCLDGCASEGGAAIGSENGSVLFAIRDFREKYPSGYTFRGLDGERAEAAVWLWPPRAEAMDFRHYADRGYSQVYYEGYPEKGADPKGIACTSEFSLAFSGEMIPTDDALCKFAESVQKPAQYVGEPEYYHKLKAFGPWSLPGRGTPLAARLEEQLNKAAGFYLREAEQRNWYGMFNYGDFMHSYDRYRHQWRYDMGGFAWDNTELVPTLWLWFEFLRTGREDIFTLAEKLSRHASEVDMYHAGPLKGLGSRHNVRHWGCPCKEARVAMAAHHRVYYYLTGDFRLGEIFEELKDSEQALLNRDPLGAFYKKEEMVYPTHARSGPDWSSLCANWMTRWERFGDERYRRKISTGIADIEKAPLRLISGPDFEFEPETGHLRYIGEQATGGTHLQVCMGATQVWLELTDLLEEEEWKRMLAEYGRFYFLDRERQMAESGGLIGSRKFSFPYMAAALGAYGAVAYGSRELAEAVWRCLWEELEKYGGKQGFTPAVISGRGNRKELWELPWISTNFAAQWCLNVIVCLELIGDWLPEELWDEL